MVTKKSDKWFLYMIRTDTLALYTGITTNIERRFQEHCDVHGAKPNAKGAKYFRFVKPVEVVYTEEFANRSEASKREREVKKMPKSKKLMLVSHQA